MVWYRYLFFLAPQEEPISVMDLENRVSRRLWALPTRVALLPSRQPVDFGFQRPDSDSQQTVAKADGGGAHPTRIWIAGGQNFWLAGVQSPEPRVTQDASFGMEGELWEGDVEFMLPVRVVPGAAPGTHNMVVSATYQSWNNELCPPPKTMKAQVPVTIGK
jgi:hypothetical protein